MEFDSLEYFEPEEKYGNTKATVHQSGKLGFTSGAAKLINFETNQYFKIGRRKDNNLSGLEVLYMVPVAEKDDLTFQAYKAGEYWYLKTKRLLSQLGIDYRNRTQNISYDVEEVKEAEKRYFKLIRKLKENVIQHG
ncbi:hypothetical protein [Chryseolinea sp. H1M3-3]|uniref:hypothetical protein n=1 Tax=Chryseolinea sp. H1M3-3 TaxID=3034144 RepID=UPI0023EC5F89|nr:hypothetical protein [Chryseolinea sp. H1M3-3]